MNFDGVIGILTAITLLILVTVLGGLLGIFVNIPSIVVVAGLSLGLQLATTGSRALLRTLSAFRVFVIEVAPATLRQEDAAQLRGLTLHLYAAGVIGTLIGWIQILANIDDWSQLGPAVAVSLLTLFYALVLSECLVRPCADRVEYLLGRDGET